MTCIRCGRPIPAGGRRGRLYCSRNCAKRASEARRAAGVAPPPAPCAGGRQPGGARRGHPCCSTRRGTRLDHGHRPPRAGRAGRGAREPPRRRADRAERGPRPHPGGVLRGASGWLRDDTSPPIRSWIERRSGELPAGFAGPVRAWLLTLLDGDTRARPRSTGTIYVYFGAVRPLVEGWALTRGHLREITTADLTAALDPLRGWQRATAISALRSLFRCAVKRGLVFADPTTRLTSPDVDRSRVPMTEAEIHAVEQLLVTPAQRLVVALAAVHAARPDTIRRLTLDDLELPNRRITLAGHQQPIADLVHQALRAWLEQRRHTWPRTPNRHVLISAKSALVSRL